jgi:uncharacterized DUF497 family protein
MPAGIDYDEFEWDERKRQSNLEKHGIDFTDAARGLLLPHLIAPARSEGEKRWVAVLPIEGRLAAVVYVVRNRRCRIISARIARRNERKAYHARFGLAPP